MPPDTTAAAAAAPADEPQQRRPDDPAHLWDPWFAPGGRTQANRNAIVAHYLPWVHRYANRSNVVTRFAGRPADHHDVRQELAIALIALVDLYEPSRLADSPGRCFQSVLMGAMPLRLIDATRAWTFGGRMRDVPAAARPKVVHAGGFSGSRDDGWDVGGARESFDPPVFNAVGDRADVEGAALGEEVVAAFPLADRSYVRQRFIDRVTLTVIAARHGRTVPWASLRGTALVPRLAELLGRPDLAGRHPTAVYEPRPERRAAA